MIPRVTDVKYLRDYKVHIEFSDGTTGVVDLEDRVVGRKGIFEPLEDVKMFRTLHLDPELHTLVWQNGADIAPETLYNMVQ